MPLSEDKRKELPAKARLKAALAPALLLALTLFLFLPFTIYMGNIEELNLPLPTILLNLLLPFAVLIAILVAVAVLLRGRSHRLWVSLVFALALLVWIEGNLIVWNYGDLNGVNINWSIYPARGIIDSIIWVALIALLLVFSGRAYRRAAFVCTALIALQFALLGFQSIQTGEVWSRGADNKGLRRAPSVISDFSKKQNVIQILLDAFSSDIFEEIVAEDPERYREAFDGFTVFRGTLGSFPTTYMSLPAMWSTKIYKNQIPMSEFFNAALKGRTTASVLHDNGYELDLTAPAGKFMKVKHTNRYTIHTPYGLTKEQYERTNTAMVFDLTLFRALPHVLKRPVYNDQSWFLQSRLPRGDKQGEEAIFQHFAHRDFLYDVIDNARVTREVPVYKLLHLFVSHTPHVANRECGFAGTSMAWNRTNAKNLLRCSLDYTVDLLDRLKELGIYDSSLIIVNADHGHGLPVEMTNREKSRIGGLATISGHANPLLAVKPPSAKSGYRVSNAEVSLTDIPDTILSILGIDEKFSGRSVFEVAEGERRTRLHSHYKWVDDKWREDYMDNITSFTVEGDIYDSTAWRALETHLSPDISFWPKNDKIDFGSDEALSHLQFGWGEKASDPVTENTYIMNLDSKASLFLSLPKDKSVTLETTIALQVGTKPVAMVVKVDGQQVGKTAVLNQPGHLVSIGVNVGPDPKRPRVSIVEFVFSEYPTGGSIGSERVVFESLAVR